MNFSAFLAELRRRRVFRVAAVYAAVAFVIAQVADIFFPGLGLPEWSLRLVLVLLILGFPVALVLAWAFDITPEGVVRTDSTMDAPAGGLPPPARGWRAAGLVGAGLLVMIVALGVSVRFWPAAWGAAAGGGAGIQSIAVLPFVNLSGEQENEYFSDGLSEELLNALARVEGLRVPARTSSFAFKGQNTDVREIARRLAVEAVLEGSVRRSGDRVRINAQLIKAADGYHLWSESYDRRIEDIFQVQDEISRAIVGALRGRLAGGGAAGVVQATQSVEAYELYLRGLHHWHRRRPEHLEQAVRLFEQAIAEDPAYAEAHAGLALTYAVLPQATMQPSPQAAVRGKAAARRALELNPTLAEAHAALGQIAQYAEWDWAEAERNYRRAVELNSSYATAHQWRAELFQLQGRLDESQADLQRALRLDPLSLIINFMTAFNHLLREEYDLAIAQAHRALELDPSFERALHVLMLAHLFRSEFDQAAEAGRRMAAAAGLPPEVLEAVARARQSPAHRAAARRALADPDVQRAMGPLRLAMNYATVDDRDAALAAAARVVEERSPLANVVIISPVFRSYRADPRHIRLRQQMGLN